MPLFVIDVRLSIELEHGSLKQAQATAASLAQTMVAAASSQLKPEAIKGILTSVSPCSDGPNFEPRVIE